MRKTAFIQTAQSQETIPASPYSLCSPSRSFYSSAISHLYSPPAHPASNNARGNKPADGDAAAVSFYFWERDWKFLVGADAQCRQYRLSDKWTIVQGAVGSEGVVSQLFPALRLITFSNSTAKKTTVESIIVIASSMAVSGSVLKIGFRKGT
jgi:hypothetical protein